MLKHAASHINNNEGLNTEKYMQNYKNRQKIRTYVFGGGFLFALMYLFLTKDKSEKNDMIRMNICVYNYQLKK